MDKQVIGSMCAVFFEQNGQRFNMSCEAAGGFTKVNISKGNEALDTLSRVCFAYSTNTQFINEFGKHEIRPSVAAGCITGQVTHEEFLKFLQCSETGCSGEDFKKCLAENLN